MKNMDAKILKTKRKKRLAELKPDLGKIKSCGPSWGIAELFSDQVSVYVF
jgi:hypothetical protein